MKITRKFTQAGQDPFTTVKWTTRSSRITNPDGSLVFEMTDAEVPASWSQLATDIAVSKYFRKAGVPEMIEPGAIIAEGWEIASARTKDGVPAGVKKDAEGSVLTGPERSVRQLVHRLAGCWRHWGERHGYFDEIEDGQAFYDELVYMLLHQMAAPNSPQWFNTGLNWAYGIAGPAQGHWVPDAKTGEVALAGDAYTHPQPHACFIQSVDDDLVNEGGIMDLWVREARLFKYGSGTGTNFSRLRGEGERLSGGGKSSGLMSWLKIGDRAASAIKSGGTTRRAAKMVCLDMDHPDIERFVNWKVREEIKVAAMVEGMRAIAGERASIHDPETVGETASRLGLALDYDFNGEAYASVSGQNSNNSVRIPDAFFEAVDARGPWFTRWRTNGEVAGTLDARTLWDDIAYAAWRCADPGVQYDGTINAWHTCPGAGRINASNPCSEYMFLDNTACNLASLNLMTFYDAPSRHFDVRAYEHATDLWTMVLEISVLMAAYPSREVAELSWTYRTLGLGYANLGAMLMQAGIPYDSEEARAICGCLTAILTGGSYRMSARMAGEHGPFPGYASEEEHVLRVIRNHRRAAHGVDREALEWEGLNPQTRPVPIDQALCRSGGVPVANTPELLDRARMAWDQAIQLGEQHGFRNAQTTVIAPTGTIGLLMDCDTTGVEPDFALVKFKKLAGGGYFKIANASVKPALESMGYAEDERQAMLRYLLGALHLEVPLPEGVPGAQEGQTLAQWLRGRGLEEGDLKAIADALPGVFELGFAFTAWSLGDDVLERAGIDAEAAKQDPGFNLLTDLGMTPAHVEELNRVICGTQTLEGAPHLKPEHLPVFDCANKCGPLGRRYIEAQGHIRMMAAAQPFISGAISKTINLPNEASVDDIKDCYRLSWELGLKANALYRDGCKLSQPLSSTSGSSAESAADAAAEVDLEDATEIDELGEAEALEEVAELTVNVAQLASDEDEDAAERTTERIVHRPMRRRLPDTRGSITHKFNVAGHEGYLTIGLYEDGMPGEVFITMAKEGSTIGGLMDSLGTAVSVSLQYGVPLESLVRKFTHQRFEPAGMTTNRDIPIAKSLVDYIFRWMGIQFIPGYREANAPRRLGEGESDSSGQPGSQPGGRPASLPPAQTRDAEATRSPRLSPMSAADLAADGEASRVARAALLTQTARDRSAGDLGGSAIAPVVEVSQKPAQASGSSAGGTQSSVLSQMLETMADAPACDVCGTITVRNGTCYKCLNCGNSMGCS
ncbi:MAG: adenosylcobalamin-dependent ribonucleoside-diphosphate reductase [Planctomycetota bacterium]